MRSVGQEWGRGEEGLSSMGSVGEKRCARFWRLEAMEAHCLVEEACWFFMDLRVASVFFRNRESLSKSGPRWWRVE